MKSAGTRFGSHLLVPDDDWYCALGAQLRSSFLDWLESTVGPGCNYPITGHRWGRGHWQWFWLDTRRSEFETPKWEKDGFVVVFHDHRKAVLAKMIWGGRDLT